MRARGVLPGRARVDVRAVRRAVRAGGRQRGGPSVRGGAGIAHEEDCHKDDDLPTVIDLTGDRRVLKVTTRAGLEGVRPAEDDEVYVLFNGSIEFLDNHSTVYDGKNISGVRFDSTHAGNTSESKWAGVSLPRSFVVGAGNTLTGWDLAVRTMTKLEPMCTQI